MKQQIASFRKGSVLHAQNHISGTGSTIFAKNVLGDSMLTPSLADSVIALYDIDPQRLEESHLMLTALNNNLGNKARIETYWRR